MDNIRPKTYEEIKLLKNCLILRDCITYMSDEMFSKIYDYLKERGNFISVSDGTLVFMKSVDRTLVKNQGVPGIAEYESVPVTLKGIYERILISMGTISISHNSENICKAVMDSDRQKPLGRIWGNETKNKADRNKNSGSGSSSYSGCGGCGGCGGGGCGGNNNNNNNA